MMLSVCTMRISMIVVSIMGISMITMSSSYFMKLYSIMSIILWAIKTNMRKIVPHRKKSSIDNIWKKEFIEHEHNPEWYNHSLMRHNKRINKWSLYYFEVVWHIAKYYKYGSNFKYIWLFDHVNQYRKKTKYEIKSGRKILERIKNWFFWFCGDKSAMNWKKNGKKENKINSNTDNKDRKTERKKSTLSSKWTIS